MELNIDKSDNSNSLLVMPPQIRLKYMQLKFHILEAQQLPDMDTIFNTFKKKIFHECDGFISIEFMGLKVNTSVYVMKKNVCKWNETIYVHLIHYYRFL